MKKMAIFMVITGMLLGLCACGSNTIKEGPGKTTSTTQKQPDPTTPTEPTTPAVEQADPVGVYRCIGLSTEGPDDYQDVDYGQLSIYDDNTGDVYFDDYYHDFTWTMEDNRFFATTLDETAVSIEGTLKDGIMELVYEENVYLRFQLKTQQELEQEAVDRLRDSMVDSKMAMAVAYLGWYEGDEDFGTWLTENCPMLLEEHPFIANIPQEQIVGECGEVYCLVPKDHKAQVTIGRLKEGAFYEVENTLYQRDNGDPILLLCNFDGSYPNTEVLIKDSTGQDLRFYPQTGDAGGVVVPTDDYYEELALDFTYYFEVCQDYYSAMLAQGWTFPDEQYMISTCWEYQVEVDEDCYWVLNLGAEGDVKLDLMEYSATAPAKRYTGTWFLNYSDGTGLVYLIMDLSKDNGDVVTVEYVVMQCPYDNGILLGVHEDQEGWPILGEDEQVSFWWGALG